MPRRLLLVVGVRVHVAKAAGDEVDDHADARGAVDEHPGDGVAIHETAEVVVDGGLPLGVELGDVAAGPARTASSWVLPAR
jgi:hypothetical protein